MRGDNVDTVTHNTTRAPARGEADDAARKAGGVRLGYLRGLDGLRALAVAAVLVYHADAAWLPGGFLGVEVFFVISGYLITALLLAEWRERGKIDVFGFWLRRARRLLPAAFLTILTTLTFSVLFLPEEVAGLRADALAAFGYVTNWYLVFGNESYFEAVGRPSLLRHLWSLAVEEQFYLLWPLAVVAGLALWRRGGVLVTAVAGAGASALLMAFLYVPDADPSRLYYGTDTRAAGLLVGAALACLWVPGRGEKAAPDRASVERRLSRRDRRTRKLRRRWGWAAPLLLDVAGILALGGLLGFCLWTSEYAAFLYRGGFALVALTTAVLIAAAVHPHAHLGFLDARPLRWIGVRSYGIYLWHWPVYMVTRPQLDVPLEGPVLLAVRLALTLVIADLSYRYVETPIRRGALERAWRSWRDAHTYRRRRLGAGLAGAAVAVVALSAALGTAVVQAEQPDKPSYLAKKELHTKAPNGTPSDGEKGGPGEAENTAAAPNASGSDGSEPENGGKADPGAASAGPVGSVTAVGDSVMLGASAQLEKEIGALEVMDAEVGMYPGDAVEILRSRRDTGQLGDVVIVHVGENGPFSESEFDEMMEVLGDDRRVVFVNVKVPRPWESTNNAVISSGVEEHDNAVLVDWYSASSARPDLFWDDGIHLRPEGAEFYADLISDGLAPKN